MTGLTISEMAEMISKSEKRKIDKNAVLQRLFVAKIKPITKEAIYDTSALKAISNVRGRGRPKKITEPSRGKRAKK